MLKSRILRAKTYENLLLILLAVMVGVDTRFLGFHCRFPYRHNICYILYFIFRAGVSCVHSVTCGMLVVEKR